jgi:hypothetical protein
VDDVEKKTFLTLPGLELRPLGRSAVSQSLYLLRYPGSLPMIRNKWKLDRNSSVSERDTERIKN